jgi:nucleoside 2-deoxyribosyltransferase
MKFYIAALYGRRDEMRSYEKRLVAMGHEPTARWLWENDESNWDVGSSMDIADIDEADTVITFTQPRGSFNSGGGRHFELGYAFAKKKPIVLIGPREIVFHHLPQIMRYDNFDKFLEYMRS